MAFWTPAEIVGAIVFDALDASNITLNGSNVSDWDDMFDVGVTASQTTVAAQPAMGAGVVTFDGGDSLSISGSASASWCKALHYTGGTIISLAKFGVSDDPIANYVLCGTNGTAGSKAGFVLGYEDRTSYCATTSDALYFSTTNGSGHIASWYTETGGCATNFNGVLDSNLDKIIAARFRPQYSTVSERFLANVDGGDAITGSLNTVTTSSSADAGYDFQIGATNGVGGLIGSIKSLCIVPSILSDLEVQMVEGWMAHRHGVSSLLPSNHPYKDAPPYLPVTGSMSSTDEGEDAFAASGVASEWTPAEIAVAIWLDGADSNTVVLNGSTVSQWNDRSGNGRHLTQATAENQPVRITDGLHFDGSRSMASASWVPGNNCSVFAVVANARETLDTGIIDAVVSFGPFPAIPDNKGMSFSTFNAFSNVTQRQFFKEALATGYGVVHKDGLISIDQADKYLAYEERCIATVHNYSTDSTSGRYFTLGLLRVDITDYYGKNYIHEVIVVEPAADADLTSKIEGYLAHKWSLTSELPASHPYKTNAPTKDDTPLWTPAEISTAQWLDANDYSTLTIDSGLVSEWRDKSPNGYDVAQTVADIKPAYTENAMNGKPVLSFNNDSLVNSFTKTECVHHVFIVSLDATAPNSGCAQATSGTCLYNNNDGALVYAEQGGVGEALSTGSIGAHCHRSGAIHNILYHTVGMSGGNLTHFSWNTRTPSLYLNGAFIKTGLTAPQTANFRFNIGVGHYGYFIGGIAEKIVIIGTLSDSDRRKIEGYLAHKWGLAYRLPVSHPYKINPPRATQQWTPLELTSSRWWDATDAQNGVVASWTDKSGNGRNMIQSTTTKMPISDGSSIFTDGVDDELEVDLTCLIGSTYWELAVVTFCSVYQPVLGSLVNVDRGMAQQYVRDNGVYWSHNSPGTDISLTSLTPLKEIGDTILTCFDYASNTMKWWRDGVERASLSTTKTLTALASGRLGRRQASPYYFQTKTHEIIITNTRPSDDLRKKIEGYVAHKWDAILGITDLVDSLPVDHPYKSGPPLIFITGDLSAAETGEDGFACTGEAGDSSLVSGTLASTESGQDQLVGFGQIIVAGSLTKTEVGQDQVAGLGQVIVSGSLARSEVGQDQVAGLGQVVVSGSLAQTEVGQDQITGLGQIVVAGTLSIVEAGPDQLASAGKVLVAGIMASTETGQDQLATTGRVLIEGALAALEAGDDVFFAYSESLPDVVGALLTSEFGSDGLSAAGHVLIFGVATLLETGQDHAEILGMVLILGSAAMNEVGADSFFATSIQISSEHFPVILDVRRRGFDFSWTPRKRGY